MRVGRRGHGFEPLAGTQLIRTGAFGSFRGHLWEQTTCKPLSGEASRRACPVEGFDEGLPAGGFDAGGFDANKAIN